MPKAHSNFIKHAAARTGLILLLTMIALIPHCSAEDAIVHRAKAAIIYNCVNGMTWPKTRNSDSRWVIGVIGDDKVRTVLARELAGKTTAGKSFSIIEPSADIRNCHVVFVGESERRSVAGISTQARESGVLTIGETDDGFMIRVKFESERIRTSVDVPQLKQAGLKPSADILRVLSK